MQLNAIRWWSSHLVAKSQQTILLNLGIYQKMFRKRCCSWINYPHNPTGALTNEDHLKRLIQYKEYDVIILGDKELIKYIAKSRANFGVATPVPIQMAAVTAWNDDTHVIERRKIFTERLDYAHWLFTVSV